MFQNEGNGEAGINSMDEREEREAILREDAFGGVGQDSGWAPEGGPFCPACGADWSRMSCDSGCENAPHIDERYDEADHGDPGEGDEGDIYPPDAEDRHLDGFWDDRAETFGYFG